MIEKKIVVYYPEDNRRCMKLLFTQEQDDSNNWTCHMTNETMEDISNVFTVETKNN